MEMSALADSSTVVAVDHQTSTQIKGESVVLDLEEGVYYGLNDVGARVWELVQEPARVSELVDAIAEEYDVPREQCIGDVKELLHDLEGYGLIRVEQ